jgi:hypothetical protein
MDYCRVSQVSRKTRLVLTAFVLLVFLGSGYYGAREAAPHSADHLTVTVTRTSISPEALLAA